MNPLDPSTWIADPWFLMTLALGAGLGFIAAAVQGWRRRIGVAKLETGGREGSEDLKSFLQMNPEERFDLEALNSLDFRALAYEVGKRRISREVMHQIDGLLHRVRSETEDPPLAGAILRNKALDWYHRSPSDPEWIRTMPLRWGGIFHETRVPGGRLSPKLSARLVSLRLECAKASGFVGVLLRIALMIKSLRHLFTRRSLRNLISGSFRRGSTQPPEQPLAQVCQAFLDDLAASARPPDRGFGMERLSELARRVGPPEVNRTLGELFPRDGTRPVVVLDARFHPDVKDVIIRSPPAKASGEAITYELARLEASSNSSSQDDASAEAAGDSPWTRSGLSGDEWKGILDGLQKRRGRLEPPPVDSYRNNEPYLALRKLMVADLLACKTFLSVHWKGKPSGLVLLARLLSQGNFAPEVETDGDYLEAELGHLEKGNPDSRPKDGRWDLGNGRMVVREIADGSTRTYRTATGTLEPLKAAASVS